MNISELKQLQAVDGWVDFGGQIAKVGELKQRIKSDKSKTPGAQYNVIKLTVQDETDSIGVWAYADKQFLPNQYVTANGMLKEFNNVRYIDYATVKIGQVTTTAPVSQPQPTSNQPPQGVSAAPESPKPPSGNTEAIKTRHDVVCALLAGAGGRSLSAVDADYWIEYIATGRAPVPPAIDRSQSQLAAQEIQDKSPSF